MQPAVYRRGETNINKRFIETKFAGFFKAVLGPAEKDMWVVWVTATGGELLTHVPTDLWICQA